MMKHTLLAIAVFALLLFGCIGGTGYGTPTPPPATPPTSTQTPVATPTPIRTPSETPAITPAATPTPPPSQTPTPTPAQTPRTASVEIRSFTFNPDPLTVQVGTTVTWTNADSALHTVTSDDFGRTLDSPTLSNGQSWSHTFTTPGTFEYHCNIHRAMRGTVIVPG